LSVQGCFYFVNLADASPWLRRSWSPIYSVLVLVLLLLLLIILILRTINFFFGFSQVRQNF
jgi:hypothetical protein